MPRRIKRLVKKRIVGVSAEPGTYKPTKKPDHPALDYSILYYTKADRLVTVAEAAKVSAYTHTKIYHLIERGYLPFIKDDKNQYLIALETAVFLREELQRIKESGSISSHMWVQATDRKKWKDKLNSDERIRKRVIDGHGTIKANRRAKNTEYNRVKRAMTREEKKIRPIYKKDLFTGERYVAYYDDNWSVNKRKYEHNTT